MNLTSKISLILVALAITLGMMTTTYQPVSAAVTSSQSCTRWHTVQRGEYLALIADLYDTNWYTIAEINRLGNPNIIIHGQKLCVFDNTFAANPPITVSINSSNANVVALNVKEDQYVTLQGKNLAANSRYSVYLGKFNAEPMYKYLVGSVSTDKLGSFKETFSIPKKLYDVLKISISISNLRGNSTSNWFINNTSSGNTGGIGSPELSLSVQSVNKHDWVKVITNHLPANVTFHVYINKPGAPERKAILVGTLRDIKGGSVVATYNIPDSFKELSMMEIYAVNDALEMTALASFDNKNTK